MKHPLDDEFYVPHLQLLPAATLDVLPNNSHVITGLLSSVSFSHIYYLQFKIQNFL